MRKVFPSYFSGAVLGAIGYLIGNNYVTHFIGVGNEVDGVNFDEQALVIGFIGLLLGWLIGIGAFNYPFTWLLGLKDPDHEEELRLAGKDEWRYALLPLHHRSQSGGHPVSRRHDDYAGAGWPGRDAHPLGVDSPGAKAFPTGRITPSSPCMA